jgi:hypothetical protein
MRFRLALSVQLVSLSEHGVDPVRLTVQRDHALTVELTSVGEDGQRAPALYCNVATEFDPSSVVVDAFRHLAEARLPPKHLPRTEWPQPLDYIGEDGTISANYIVPLAIMPQSFKEFTARLSGELNTVGRDAVGVLRWRGAAPGPVNAFSARPAEWELDGERWRMFPISGHVQPADVAHLALSAAAVSELQTLLDDDEKEPLAHSLLREAWSQRTANPRSALLMGFTAAEIGVKEYITDCVPGAAWLVENVPSPNIVTLLRDYLPKLICRVVCQVGVFDCVRVAGGLGWSGERGAGLGVGVASLMMRGLGTPGPGFVLPACAV